MDREQKTREGSPSVRHTTYPAVKPGLVLLQKESRYAPSSGEIRLSRTRSAVTFAPIGYPHKNPASTAKHPLGLI